MPDADGDMTGAHHKRNRKLALLDKHEGYSVEAKALTVQKRRAGMKRAALDPCSDERLVDGAVACSPPRTLHRPGEGR